MKTHKTITAILFILLIGLIPLSWLQPVYGFSFNTDVKPWITNIFSRTKPIIPVKPINTNTSWIKDFLAKHPQYKEKDIVKRDQYSVHIKQPDGKILAEIAQAPINYKNSQGQWVTLDTAITKSDNSSYDYQNTTNSFQTLFSSDAYQDAGNIQLVKGDASLTIKTIDKLTFTDRNETLTMNDLTPKTPQEKQAKKGVVDATQPNKICYPDLYVKDGKKMDVCYIVHEGRIQEQLILNAYQGYPELTQTITLHNAYAKKEGKQIAFYNTKTNELLWYILDPVIYEQNGKSANHDLYYNVTCNIPSTPLASCWNLSITKILESKAKEYLADPKRIYPVTIDPDYACTTADADIYSNSTPYATAHTTPSGIDDVTENWVGQLLYQSKYNINRTYLEFDTSAIPDTATVTQVNLKLVAIEDDSITDFDIDIVKQNWSAQDPLSSGNQSTAYNNTLSAALDSNIWRNTSGMSINTQYASGNLSTAWINLTGSTYYSLISSRDKASTTPTVDEFIKLASQSNATAGYRPILTVTYTTGLANGQACTLGSQCTSTFCVDLTCCNTTCTGSTCQICNSSSNAGAGTCGYISSAIDPGSECGALDCHTGGTKYYNGWASNVCYYKADISAANALCTGTSMACQTLATQCTASTQGLTAGVTRTTCKTQVGCTGTTVGSLGNVVAGSDTSSDCGAVLCGSTATTKYYSGWAGSVCYYKADVSAANATCDGAGACKTQAVECTASAQGASTGVSATACQTQVGCTGTTAGTTGNVTAGTDPNNGCASYSCTSKVNGWSGNSCIAAVAAATDGDCNGSGACNTTFASQCTGGGTTLATCGSAACKNAAACVQDSASTTSDTAAEICYTSGQHSCASGYACDATGTCAVPTCANIPVSGDFALTSACAFPGTVNGVDAGSGTTNTAKLVVGSVGTPGNLTVLENQTLAVGSIQMINGSIVIIKGSPGGVIKLKTPIYLPDADGDGYPSSDTSTQYTSAAAGRARRSHAADSNEAQACADTDTNVAGVTGSTLVGTLCKKCVTGALTNQTGGENLFNQCSTFVCASSVWGWSTNSCLAADYTSQNGNCNGAGACSVFSNSCFAGATLATCGSAGCVNAAACVQGTASTTSDTAAEICYTSAQHSCSAGQVCNASGTCTGAAIALVQQQTNRNTYGAPSNPGFITVTLSPAATAGNLLITGVAIDKASGTITVPTGFTLVQKGEGGVSSGAMAYKIAAGGETAITWNWVAAEEGTAWVGEYSGLATSNVLDKSAENEADLSIAVASIATGTTAATTQNDELAVGMLITDSGNSVGTTRSWTNSFSSIFEQPVPFDSGAPFLAVATKILSATGAVTSTASFNGSDECYATVATFKKAP